MDLTAEQEAEARRIYELLKDKVDADLMAMARLLASKETGELFGRTELEVRDRVHAIGAQALEGALAGRKKGGYLGCSIACPHCDRSANFQRYQARRVVSALGCVRYERAYYYCRHCHHGATPADATLHVDQAELTPAARELVALAGTLSSFAEAAEKVLPRLAGIRVSESTAERATEAAGAELGQRLAAGAVFGGGRPWRWSTDATGRTVGYVSLDATGVGIQGPNGAAAEGRMANVGLIFDPGPDGRPGRMRALAGLYSLEELGPPMRRQAEQVGLDAADVWVGLTDGGSGLDEFLRVYFPRAELVLDFYHAAEHLNELAQALHPTDDEAARALAGRWCHQLKHEGGAALLATLAGIDLRGRKADVRERHRLVSGYVGNNRFRMDYPRYRANGWLIGSGHVESACKGVVGLRLKGSGMRWSETGADAVCHLRALFKSEKGQWDAFWALAP